ncbi:MAG: pseudouridine synthase [Gemmatimonadetes bacterium]|nr:pseudouridine synthase [Gemmatimonadota bacterium]
MTETMRIHRALARAGVASRRHAETLIAEGRVLVNGEVARVGQSVNPARDRIQVDGNDVPIAPARNTWYVLNKPAGFMTTRSDPENRRTVFELVPDVPGLTYVGRLDFLTEGVLLLTTDGEAAHRLTHPSAEVERVYVATVRGNAKAAAEAARAGVELEDGLVKPAWVNVMPMENRFWAFEIAIREGRTREIRRLCDALGLEVSHLVRTQFGPVRIGHLEPGSWRELSPREAAMLEVLTGTDVPAGKPPRRRDDRASGGRDRRAGAQGRGGERAGAARGGTARGGTARGGTARGGTARGGTERGGTERGGTERGGTERGGTERGGSARAGSARAGSARSSGGSGVAGKRPARSDRPPRDERSARDNPTKGTPRGRVSSSKRRPRSD